MRVWKGRRGYDAWPGRGPFSYLPPWERPGWLYGPGACWQLYASRPYTRAPTPDEETVYLETCMKELKQELEGVEARINQLRKAESKE